MIPKALRPAWKRQYGLSFPVLRDSDGTLSVAFGVTGTPESFFVDPAGTVRYRIAGEVTSELLFSFVHWMSTHSQASEQEATQALYEFR